MNFISGKQLLELCHAKKCSISQIMIEREQSIFKCKQKEIMARMATAYDIMKQAAERALRENLVSISGKSGGISKHLFFNADKKSVCGEMMSKAMSYAVGVLEVNQSMGMIVATPTADASGVIPGVFLAMQEYFEISDEMMVKALFNAGAVGYLMTNKINVAKVESSPQMEVGMASAMAASAVCEMMGASAKVSLQAATIAMMNLSEFKSSPIPDSIEEPCYKRNAMGVSNALISAEMALCGVEYMISFDEAMEIIYRI